MNDTIDPLQTKIGQARALLPKETLEAIDAVDWKTAILKIKDKKGYTISQLSDLEIETELLLCGLLNPTSYAKELENRMHISKVEVDDILKEMNESVFKKIREELMRITENPKVAIGKSPVAQSNQTTMGKGDTHILSSAGIEITEKGNPVPINTPTQKTVVKMEDVKSTPSISVQKLSGAVQSKVINTDHSLNNISKPSTPTSYADKKDPYKEIPE